MSHGPLCDRPPSPQPASVDGANVTRRGAKWQNEPIERDAACYSKPDNHFGAAGGAEIVADCQEMSGRAAKRCQVGVRRCGESRRLPLFREKVSTTD